MLKQMFHGACMALADSVPGVSGGTIAFILGFYDKFIGSIDDLIYGKGEERKEAFVYLVKLGLGWVIGMIGAVLVLSSVFQSHIYAVSSLFMGFVAASIPVVLKEEKDSYAHHMKNIGFAVIGILLVVGTTYLNHTMLLTGVQLNQLNVPMMIYIFVAGMIAISAMFVPGISGSTLLLIFGLYMPVILAIKETLHFNLTYVPGLCVFGIGVIAGAVSVVRGIKVCLHQYRSKTMYTLLGLMIGSFYAIVQGPTTLETPLQSLSVLNFNFIAFIIGIIIVFTLQFLGSKK